MPPAEGPPSFAAGLALGTGVGLGSLVVTFLGDRVLIFAVGGVLLACGTTSRHASRARISGVAAGAVLAVAIVLAIVCTAWGLMQAETAYALFQRYRG